MSASDSEASLSSNPWPENPGAGHNGSSWDGFDVVETPSFTLFDAMLSYETERWTWTLNATNLEDEYHLTTCLNRGDCFIGAGREITTGLTYKF